MMTAGKRLLTAGLMAMLWGAAPGVTWAAIEAREFSTPLLEQRYQVLMQELRCPKCQNTNLAGSDAGLAGDLKDRVHQLLEEGRSDQEIRALLTDRYGDFISYKPPVKPVTYLLWWGPGVLLVLALARVLWRRRSVPLRSEALTPEEKARLQAVLSQRSESARD